MPGLTKCSIRQEKVHEHEPLGSRCTGRWRWAPTINGWMFENARTVRVHWIGITCSAYMVNTDHPLLQFSDRAYRVALSNHADFEGTLAYVEATGAKRVVTDTQEAMESTWPLRSTAAFRASTQNRLRMALCRPDAYSRLHGHRSWGFYAAVSQS